MTEAQGTDVLTALTKLSTQVDACGMLLANISLYVAACALLLGVLIVCVIVEGKAS